MPAAFQNVLGLALKVRGWNQVEAARHLGVSQALVSAYLHGEREPLLSTAAQISGVLGVSLDEMAGLSAGKSAVAWQANLKRRWHREAASRSELAAALRIVFCEDSTAVVKWLNEPC